MSRPQVPRLRVDLADLPEDAVDQGPGPLIGLTAGGAAPVYLGPGSGHTLLVAWPGMGTTTVLRTVAAQYARRGTQVDILDVAGQHTWARAQRRVHLYEDAASVHRRLYQLADQVRAQRSGPPRVVVVESDQTVTALLRFRHYPVPGGTGLDALTAVLAAGRLYGIRVVMACRAVPAPMGHVARDLFTTRLLSAPTPRTWDLVGSPGRAAPQEEPFRIGRMHLVGMGGDEVVQLLRLSDLQAAYLAAAPAPAARSPRVRHRPLIRLPAVAPAVSTFQIPPT
ncbi:ATP-binding protein [Streptomyces yaizuensis]|uniref:ATP-binding protein n=1 Tax=Streptomyces yaizuensis TaxID=2989713 RepID=A0ABQ5P6Q5_9ACTN|nr:ATP-binding protein [Streptomyces sp. YSPA8]GLF98283.1 ATP-binding protein [Streptomyces sp. YSPA8]